MLTVSKILMDATIPFQIKPWEYEEMKNSDGKVNFLSSLYRIAHLLVLLFQML